MKYIVGNWKSNKTLEESSKWLEQFNKIYKQSNTSKVIVCPSFIHIPLMVNASFSLGLQNLSPFEQGAYTGEVAAEQLAGIVEYALIGHSERREYFQETDSQLKKKVAQARQFDIEPIYCVQSEKTPIPEGVQIIAYEPVEAIGTGNPEDPANCRSVFAKIVKRQPEIKTCLYGGSVKADNAAAFLQEPTIDGVLVGGASLDPVEFAKIVTYASQNQT